MQLRRLAALERQKIIDRLAELELDHRRPRGHPGQRGAAAADRHRRARPRSSRSTATTGARQIIAADGDLSMEDLIPDEDLVVSITRGGYAKRTRADQYRTQKRGGKGVRGATPARRRRRRALHRDDQPPLAAVLHHGRPGLPHQGLQPARGAARRQGRPRGRAAVASSPTRTSRRCWRSATTSRRRTSCSPPATGLVKKTRLGDYNSPRQAGVIAINFREDDDELIGAELVERRRRHPAGLPQGPGDPVPRRRHPAAADGPRDVRRRRA